MEIVDIADEIFRELGEPDDISLAAIGFWIRSNIGPFGDLINIDFVITDDAFDPALTDSEKSILKTLYYIYYYKRQVNKNLGAAAYASFLELKEGDVSVRRVNKTEVAKSYNLLIREAKENLSQQLIAYINRNGHVEDFSTINPITSEDFEGIFRTPRSILSYTRNI